MSLTREEFESLEIGDILRDSIFSSPHAENWYLVSQIRAGVHDDPESRPIRVSYMKDISTNPTESYDAGWYSAQIFSIRKKKNPKPVEQVAIPATTFWMAMDNQPKKL